MYNNVLIYGFGPYGRYPCNITTGIIKEIQNLKLAQSVIFETRFSRKMFETTVRRYMPNVVIGLGQDSRAKKIRIERRAVNWRKPLKSKGRVISNDGPKYRYVSLKLTGTADTTITYDAGEYVCNFSMYIMCEYCEKMNKQFAFLHLPQNVDVKKAVWLISELLQTINLNNVD